jgi:uncharacterized protein (TIGR03435 family)
MNSDLSNIDEVIKRHLPSASSEDMESGGARVRQRLESGGETQAQSAELLLPLPSWSWWPAAAAGFAILAVLAIPFLNSLISPNKFYAIVEAGPVYSVGEGKTRMIRVGEKIDIGSRLRTDDVAHAILKLSDGASIEMRAKSDLSLESIEDGMRIRLNDGSVNVTPSKQPAVNLYVQNKEVTVPVTATVFQSVAAPRSEQNPQPRETFDVVSIRTRPGAGGGGGGPRGEGGGGGGGVPGRCAGRTPQIDPSRFAASSMGIYNLTAFAYGISAGSSADLTSRCMNAAGRLLLSGGPDWIDNDTFDIEATIPDGAPTFTPRVFSNSFTINEATTRLQKMLQSMLESRFKLVLRRELKEMPVYLLTVAPGGHKLTPSKEGDLANFGQMSTFMIYNPRELPFSPKPDYERQRVSFFYGARATTGWLAGSLSYYTNRVVLDRTGLTGDYNYQLVFAPLNPPVVASADGLPVMTSPTLFRALENEFGLELKPSTEKVEVFVIERLERPTEN